MSVQKEKNHQGVCEACNAGRIYLQRMQGDGDLYWLGRLERLEQKLLRV